MVYIEMKFDPSQRISALCQNAIGRQPTVIGQSGTHTILIEFDPPLNATEKQTLLQALPSWVRDLWTIEEKSGTLKPY